MAEMRFQDTKVIKEVRLRAEFLAIVHDQARGLNILGNETTIAAERDEIIKAAKERQAKNKILFEKDE